MNARLKHRALLCGLLLLAVLALDASWGRPPAARALATILVDRSDDADVSACTAAANDCTLRGAIQWANANGSYNTIHFDYGVTEIDLTQPPPAITGEGTCIEGRDPDWNLVYPVIDGSGIADDHAHFEIQADGVMLTSLAIVNMPPNGPDIVIESSQVHDVSISYNYLGVRPQDTSCGAAGLVRSGYTAVRIAGDLAGSSGSKNGTAYIYANVIGCHTDLGDDAVQIVDSNWVYVGEDSSGAVRPNYIGTDAQGHDLGNRAGVHVTTYQDNGDMDVTIHQNWIANGTTEGIALFRATTVGVLITGTTIYDNGGAGILESGGAVNNTWSHVSIYDNGGLGIDVGDDGVPAGHLPVVTAVDQATGVVSGTATATIPSFYNVTVELYRIALDPSGYGEGKTYVGSADVDTEGYWTIVDPAGTRGCYTAFQTSRYVLGSSHSSEFGPSSCRVLLPLVARSGGGRSGR